VQSGFGCIDGGKCCDHSDEDSGGEKADNDKCYDEETSCEEAPEESRDAQSQHASRDSGYQSDTGNQNNFGDSCNSGYADAQSQVNQPSAAREYSRAAFPFQAIRRKR
jgi:hypothetical protein